MSKAKSLKESIREILFKRLAVAFVIIMAVLVVLVLIFQLEEISDLANEQAVQSVGRFNAQVMDILDNPSTMNAESFIKRLSYLGNTGPTTSLGILSTVQSLI